MSSIYTKTNARWVAITTYKTCDLLQLPTVFQPHSLSQIPKSNSLVQTKSQFTKLARMKKSKLNQSRWRSRNQSLKWWWWWHLATREWRCDKRQQKVCSMASILPFLIPSGPLHGLFLSSQSDGFSSQKKTSNKPHYLKWEFFSTSKTYKE
jgi:hypothetical protein